MNHISSIRQKFLSWDVLCPMITSLPLLERESLPTECLLFEDSYLSHLED
ncbi:MAG: hypothetical protein KME59_03740 [Trichormus sp. ATA11-4-KO1]|jgi:hypothetical protein|nr:hypothetical protein [Trichormus sp. ATA11-4-KO1]